jgi:hypothetical protein
MKIKFLNYNHSFVESQHKDIWEYTILVNDIKYMFVNWADNNGGEQTLRNLETEEIIKDYKNGEETKNKIFLSLAGLCSNELPLEEAFEHNCISIGDTIDTSLFDVNDNTSDYTEINGAIIKNNAI